MPQTRLDTIGLDGGNSNSHFRKRDPARVTSFVYGIPAEPIVMLDLSGMKFLIVEDEALVSMMIEDMLRDMGCDAIALSSTVQDATAKVEKEKFDAVLLDINLHGEQTDRIAHMLVERGTPFLFSTGYGTSGIPEQLRNVPVLQKPFQDAELARAMRKMLENNRE